MYVLLFCALSGHVRKREEQADVGDNQRGGRKER